MRFSVLLNFWDNFFLTLPSISSKIWVIYYYCDLGTIEFCAKLHLWCSSQFSLLKAGKFRLFLEVAVFYKKSNEQQFGLSYFIWRKSNCWLSKIIGQNKTKRLNIISMLAITIVFLVLSFLLFIPFLWWETYLFAHQVKVQIRESPIATNNIKAWNADSGGK